MGSYAGQRIRNGYADVLHIDNGNLGIDGTLRRVEDGKGGDTCLEVSTAAARIAGDLTVSGTIAGTAVTGSVLATGSTTARSLADRFADCLYVDDFGAAANGTTNDTAAFTAAFTALGAQGGEIRLRANKRYLIDTALTVPRNCTLVGPHRALGLPGNTLTQGELDALGGVLIVNSSISVTMGIESALVGVVLQRKGLVIPGITASYAGTAIKVRGTDVYLGDVTVLGFAQAVDAADATDRCARLRADRVQFDCTAGFVVDYCYDVPYFTGCHGINMLNTASPIRSGTAFEFRDVDGAFVTNCFSYGFEKGFDIFASDTTTLTACGADHASGSSGTSIGFHVRGDAKNTTMLGCFAVNKLDGFKVEPSGASANHTVSLQACYSAAATGWNYNIQSGRVFVHGCKSYGGNNGLKITGTADYSQAIGNHIYDAGTIGFLVLNTLANASYFGNVLKGNAADTTTGEKIGAQGTGTATLNYATVSVPGTLAVTGTSTLTGAVSVASTIAKTGTNALLDVAGTGTGGITLSNGNGIQFKAQSGTSTVVNYLRAAGTATGTGPALIADGSDTNLDLQLQSKGTGLVSLNANVYKPGTNTTLDVAGTGTGGVTLSNGNGVHFKAQGGSASCVNFLRASGTATGTSPALISDGSDTNLDLSLSPKGTGVVKFGTLTASGDAAVSGYITIKDSGGTTRKLAVIT